MKVTILLRVMEPPCITEDGDEGVWWGDGMSALTRCLKGQDIVFIVSAEDIFRD